MWTVNHYVSHLFDLAFIPLQYFHPFWSLLFFSILTGLIILIIFRHASDQAGIREAKNQIKAHLLEVVLFKDDLRILLSAQRKILFYNGVYMKHALKAALFMIVPIGIILIHLDGWLGYRPLTPGEATAVSIIVSDGDLLSAVRIESDPGLAIETPPVRIPAAREATWRIRAHETGEHVLTVHVAGQTLTKTVTVADGILARVSPRVATVSFFGTILNPGERPMPEHSVIEAIEVAYPPRSMHLAGFEIHWIVALFVLSIVSVFALKRLFNVEM